MIGAGWGASAAVALLRVARTFTATNRPSVPRALWVGAMCGALLTVVLLLFFTALFHLVSQLSWPTHTVVFRAIRQ